MPNSSERERKEYSVRKGFKTGHLDPRWHPSSRAPIRYRLPITLLLWGIFFQTTTSYVENQKDMYVLEQLCVVSGLDICKAIPFTIRITIWIKPKRKISDHSRFGFWSQPFQLHFPSYDQRNSGTTWIGCSRLSRERLIPEFSSKWRI